MKLKELLQELTELQEQGYSDYPVIFIHGLFHDYPVETVSVSEEKGVLMPKGILLESYIEGVE